MIEEVHMDEPSTPGARRSIVQAFGIRGLYGYRDISLASNYSATILIARNGSGKTTLIGALDAFLRRQFFRLRDLPFGEIYCKIEGIHEELVLRRRDLESLLSVPDNEEFVRIARRANISGAELLQFLTDDWTTLRSDYNAQSENKIFRSLLQYEEYSASRVVMVLDKQLQMLIDTNPNVSWLVSVLSSFLSSYDIVYLPTYRRVELALRGDKQDVGGRRRRPRLDISVGSLFTGDIQFGLSDISDRLNQMNRDVVFTSNRGYRDISASIVNELLDGTFGSHAGDDASLPAREDLELFFSRLEERGVMGPYFPVSTPNLDRIYNTKDIPEDSARFLRYFLSKLEKVILTTRETERNVQEFVESCNRYLGSEEASTDLSGDFVRLDGKRLVLNKKDFSVHVESLPEGVTIDLDALSSGEKQMVSLFAKLFLYEGPKIVLIDEPELSLSIDWQKQILVDIIRAPLCKQVIAITHSPFVFDNELEPFARSLRVERSQWEGPSSPGDLL